MAVILNDEPNFSSDFEYEDVKYSSPPAGLPDLYEVRVGSLCAAIYDPDVPRTLVAMRAVLVVLAVCRGRVESLWFFINVAGLKGWAEAGIFGVFGLVLLIGFLLGTK